jgi:hypothetical protein
MDTLYIEVLILIFSENKRLAHYEDNPVIAV